MTNRRVLLKSRPVGEPKPTDFEIADSPVPKPQDGEILVRTVWLSLDPYMRGRMNDVKSYAASVELGQPMVGGTVGEVVDSRDAAFRPGDFVLTYGGWQAYHIAKSAGARVGPFGPIKLAPPRPARSAPSSGSSQRFVAAAPSASPARRTSASTSRESSASTHASRTECPTSRPHCARPVRTGSTCTSTMSAATC
jgi:NADPH:quinone reductase-like Zn-dependent oxidoreductase